MRLFQIFYIFFEFLFVRYKLKHSLILLSFFRQKLFIMLKVFLKPLLIYFFNLFNLFWLLFNNFIDKLLILFLFLLETLNKIFVRFSLKRYLNFEVLKIVVFLNGLKFKILNFFHLSKILLLFQLKFFIEVIRRWILILFLQLENIIWRLLLSLLLKNRL